MQTIHVVMSVTKKHSVGEHESGEELVFTEQDRHHDYNTAIRKLASLKAKNPSIRYTIIDEYEFQT